VNISILEYSVAETPNKGSAYTFMVGEVGP
jgi:hypothetical protein